MTSNDADDADREPRPSGPRRPLDLVRTIVVAAVLGVVGALVTVGFIRAMEEVKDLVFTDLPDALDIQPDNRVFIIVVVVFGGALLGLARKLLGEYPASLEQAIEDHKATGQFDYRHVWQAIVISLISLGFGAALGPEAALMAIVGGLSTWIGLVIEIDRRDQPEVGIIGVAGAMGALFGIGGAALTLDPEDDDVDAVRSGRILRLMPGLAAALAR